MRLAISFATRRLAAQVLLGGAIAGLLWVAIRLSGA